MHLCIHALSQEQKIPRSLAPVPRRGENGFILLYIHAIGIYQAALVGRAEEGFSALPDPAKGRAKDGEEQADYGEGHEEIDDGKTVASLHETIWNKRPPGLRDSSRCAGGSGFEKSAVPRAICFAA